MAMGLFFLLQGGKDVNQLDSWLYCLFSRMVVGWNTNCISWLGY